MKVRFEGSRHNSLAPDRHSLFHASKTKQGRHVVLGKGNRHVEMQRRKDKQCYPGLRLTMIQVLSGVGLRGGPLWSTNADSTPVICGARYLSSHCFGENGKLLWHWHWHWHFPRQPLRGAIASVRMESSRGTGTGTVGTVHALSTRH